MTKSQQLKEIQAYIDLCFHIIGGNDREISKATGLSGSTIWRLRMGMVNLRRQIGTLDAVSRAAGLQLYSTKRKYRLKIAS